MARVRFRKGQRVYVNIPKKYFNKVGVVDDLLNDRTLVHMQLLNKHGQSQGGYFVARKYVTVRPVKIDNLLQPR